MNLEGLERWGGLAVERAEDADVVVAGIPYDGSAVYRRGAAQAPAEIRRLSAAIPPITESGAPLDGLRVHDLGDLEVGPDIETGWSQVADRLAAVRPAALLTVMGGDHCSAIPILAAQARRHPGLALLWFDAHPDLCEFSRGGRWTCGCALRRAFDVSGLEPPATILAGCRDFDLEELDVIGEMGILMMPIARVARDPVAAGAAIAEALSGRPVHVSFDIDVLDPAFAPGTEIPSAGGLSTRQALDLMAELAAGSRLVGLDVCEVSPPADPSHITTLAALKVIFEFWGQVWKQQR